jgi:hypothetical protein
MSAGWCQNRFEGIIRYRISHPGNVAEDAPGEVVYYLKRNNLMFRVYTKEGNELARILIKTDNQTFYMIDDTEKSAMKMNFSGEEQQQPGVIPDQYRETYEKAIEEEKKKSQLEQPELEYTGNTERIAGYECRIFMIRNEAGNNRDEAFLWMTDKISFQFPGNIMREENPLLQFLGSSGFPLKFKINEGEGFMEMVATEVVREKLEEDVFGIPSDYQISDLSDLMKRD